MACGKAGKIRIGTFFDNKNAIPFAAGGTKNT
jgi:hypothetical protein